MAQQICGQLKHHDRASYQCRDTNASDVAGMLWLGVVATVTTAGFTENRKTGCNLSFSQANARTVHGQRCT
jgi:hypothetical protein